MSTAKRRTSTSNQTAHPFPTSTIQFQGFCSHQESYATQWRCRGQASPQRSGRTLLPVLTVPSRPLHHSPAPFRPSIQLVQKRPPSRLATTSARVPRAEARIKSVRTRGGCMPALFAQVARLVGAVQISGSHKPCRMALLAAHLRSKQRSRVTSWTCK